MTTFSPAEIIRITREICDGFDARTTPWATSDLAEAVECNAYCGITNLPIQAFDRWMKCLRDRDARDLDYDSVERHNARCDALGCPEHKIQRHPVLDGEPLDEQRRRNI